MSYRRIVQEEVNEPYPLENQTDPNNVEDIITSQPVYFSNQTHHPPSYSEPHEIPSVSSQYTPTCPPLSLQSIPQSSQPSGNVPANSSSYINMVHPPFIPPPIGFTYAWLAALTRYCCCVPIGKVAMDRSKEAKMLYNIGDYEGGRKAAKESLKLSLIGITIGIVASAIAIVVILSIKHVIN